MGIKSYFDQKREQLSDYLFKTGMDMQAGTFWRNDNATGSIANIFMTVIVIVLAVKVIVSQLPQTILDAGNVTAAGGALANEDASTKSTWNLTKTVLLFGSVLMVVAVVLRKK